MKKLISVLLIMTMVVSLTACGGKNTEETVENAEVVTDTTTEVEDTETNATLEEEQVEVEEPATDEVEQENSTTTEENTNSSAPQTKPEENSKPEENTKPEAKPEQKPADTTEQKPADKEDGKKEEDKKEEASSATLGQTLLAVFKANAGSMGAQELADKLITNEAILFMGGSMPVEPGLLSGFDNAEITGFKEGVMFAPMMGSIAFVGYVFELEADADVEAFKKNLKANANPRWQICVSAEETIVESVGNKVFFLMCPSSLEQ